jgi:hypothetical protein
MTRKQFVFTRNKKDRHNNENEIIINITLASCRFHYMSWKNDRVCISIIVYCLLFENIKEAKIWNMKNMSLSCNM